MQELNYVARRVEINESFSMPWKLLHTDVLMSRSKAYYMTYLPSFFGICVQEGNISCMFISRQWPRAYPGLAAATSHKVWGSALLNWSEVCN